MNTVFSNLSVRSLTALVALATALSLLGVAASSALAVDVNVRIETPDETLYNGPISTGARNLISEDLSPGTVNYCDSDEPIGPPDWAPVTIPSGGATANSAVHDVAENIGISYGTSGGRYGFGIAMCRIGSYGSIDNVQTWSVKINNKSQVGGSYVNGDTPLSAGDDVLWYLGGPNVTRTTSLKLPGSAPAQGLVNGQLTIFKNGSDTAVGTVIGAKVAGGGATANVRTDGTFSIEFPEPGTYLVSATAPNAARSSALINVTAALTPAQKASLVKRRLARCRAKYRSKRGASRVAKKSNLRKYRRCARVVKSKFALGI